MVVVVCGDGANGAANCTKYAAQRSVLSNCVKYYLSIHFCFSYPDIFAQLRCCGAIVAQRVFCAIAQNIIYL